MKTECNLKQPSFHPITMPACVARSTSALANDKGTRPPPSPVRFCLFNYKSRGGGRDCIINVPNTTDYAGLLEKGHLNIGEVFKCG